MTGSHLEGARKRRLPPFSIFVTRQPQGIPVPHPTFSHQGQSLEMEINPDDFKLPAICLLEAIKEGEAHPVFQEAMQFLQQNGRLEVLNLPKLQEDLTPRDMMHMLIRSKRGIQPPEDFIPPYPDPFWEPQERDYFNFIDTVIEDTTGGDLHFFLSAVILRSLDGTEVLEPTMSGQSMEFFLTDYLKRDTATVFRLRAVLDEGSTPSVEELIAGRFRYFLNNVAEYVVHSYCPSAFKKQHGGPEQTYAHLLEDEINLPAYLDRWVDMWLNICAGTRVRDLMYDAPCTREPFLLAFRNDNGILEVRNYEGVQEFIHDTRKTIPGFGFLWVDVSKHLAGEQGMDEQFLPGNKNLRRAMLKTGRESMENARFYGTDIFVDSDNAMNWYLPGFSEFQTCMQAWKKRFPEVSTYTILDLLQTTPGSIPLDVEMALPGLLENTGFSGALSHEEVLFLEQYYENNEVVLPRSMADDKDGINQDAFFRLGFNLVDRSKNGGPTTFEDNQSNEKLILEKRKDRNIFVLRPARDEHFSEHMDALSIPDPVSTLLH